MRCKKQHRERKSKINTNGDTDIWRIRRKRRFLKKFFYYMFFSVRQVRGIIYSSLENFEGRARLQRRKCSSVSYRSSPSFSPFPRRGPLTYLLKAIDVTERMMGQVSHPQGSGYTTEGWERCGNRDADTYVSEENEGYTRCISGCARAYARIRV